MIGTPLFALVLVATAAAPAAIEPATADAMPARIEFRSGEVVTVGLAYGIDGVDSMRTVYGERVAASVAPGRRTIWYTCPGQAAPEGGARVTFEFDADARYELVCRAGAEAEIRRADNC